MNKIVILYLCKKLSNFLHGLKKKLKDNFFILLGLFLFIFFIFITTRVNAASNTLIVDGYDMSDVYTYFNEGESFYIAKIGSSYRLVVPQNTSYRKYVVNDGNCIVYANSNFSYLGGNNYKFYNYNSSTKKFVYGWTGAIDAWHSKDCIVAYSNNGVYNKDHKTFYAEPSVVFVEPYISNTDADLVSQGTNRIIIFPGSIDLDSSIRFYISRYDKTDFGDDTFIYDNVVLFDTTLNFGSDYYKSITEGGVLSEFWYEVPYSSMNVSFEKGQMYNFCLSYTDSSGEVCFVNRNIVMGSISETDKLNDNINKGFNDLATNMDKNTSEIIASNEKTQQAIKEQTSAIEENNKTNKNIFEKIGEMLSYINPFSENFFVYKLIELLLEMLKSLFIPSDNFFNDWLSDMNDYFSDRFGIIYYPFDLVIDFLTRVVDTCSNVSNNAVLNVPDFNFMGVTLIHSFTFDFNSLLVNHGLKTVYNIYLVVVDVILSLMLVNLAKNTFAEVFGGRFSDEIISDMTRSPKTNNDKE